MLGEVPARAAQDLVTTARALIARPLGDAYRDGEAVNALGSQFRRAGYVRLPGLLSSETLAIVRDDVAALEPRARAREFVMAGPDTPRVMSVLGATQLLEGAPALGTLYVHFELVGLVARLAATTIHCCPHPEELMVCNLLLANGSTHGWHLDDPPYALVIVLEAPDPGAGGELELVADWEGLCAGVGIDPHRRVQDGVEHARERGAIRVAHHRAGDAYLLRADRCLHRVTPLTEPHARRVALNFAYERRANATYGDTATLLYGQDDQGAPR
jgi:hypothetical protein